MWTSMSNNCNLEMTRNAFRLSVMEKLLLLPFFGPANLEKLLFFVATVAAETYYAKRHKNTEGKILDSKN